jgi:hypothetical protein
VEKASWAVEVRKFVYYNKGKGSSLIGKGIYLYLQTGNHQGDSVLYEGSPPSFQSLHVMMMPF